MKKYNIVLFLVFPIISACGGGGGGSTGNDFSVKNSATPVIIDTYDAVKGPVPATPENGIFTKNINNSEEEEVIIAGRSSQSVDDNDFSDWQNYEIQIYGWNTGSFSNETSTWFSGDENKILGTGPSVHFGDFDGDGNTDISVAHDTDMEYFGPSHVYFNSGSNSLKKISINHKDTWGHDSAVADFDGDGYDDFLVGSLKSNMSLSFGSSDQTFDTYQAETWPVGLGLAVGDFLGDGGVSIIATAGGNKQELYSWSINNGKLVLTKEADLPDNRFEQSKWDDERNSQKDEYSAIRAITFDFNNDGVDDVVTITSLDKDDNVHGYTEVQFLKNDGSGNFTDVTDSVLKEFDTNQVATYTPKLLDVNGDGLIDIMMSTKSFSDDPATSILVQSKDGTFVEEYVKEFQAYNDTLTSVNGDEFSATPEHAIVKGPDNKKYLVSVGINSSTDGSNSLNRVFLSEIGNDGTITVSNTVTALKNQWPWMSDSQAEQILSLTASNTIDGMPVIDYYKALSPIGGLTLDFKNGQKVYQLSGHVSGIDLNNTSVLATDDFNRTFSVDLSSSVNDAASGWHSYADITDSESMNYHTRSANLVNGDSFSLKNMTLYQSDSDLNNYSISLPSLKVRDYAYLTATFTDINFSPWVSMSGMWGEVNSSQITEGILTIKKDQWVANAGLMHTQTEITPGLITEVGDIYSVWGDIGWQHESNNFGVYGGIDPYVFSGTVTVSLPDSVGNNGDLVYTDNEVPLISEESVYFRTYIKNKFSNNLHIATSGIVRQNNKNSVSVNVNWDF